MSHSRTRKLRSTFLWQVIRNSFRLCRYYNTYLVYNYWSYLHQDLQHWFWLGTLRHITYNSVYRLKTHQPIRCLYYYCQILITSIIYHVFWKQLFDITRIWKYARYYCDKIDLNRSLHKIVILKYAIFLVLEE